MRGRGGTLAAFGAKGQANDASFSWPRSSMFFFYWAMGEWTRMWKMMDRKMCNAKRLSNVWIA